MKLLSITSALLFANAALGTRFTEKRRIRAAERDAAVRSGYGVPNIPSNGKASKAALGNDTANVQYSGNWAGAVLVGSGYTSVTGTFVVPTPKEPTGGSSSTEYAASAWVGIDGDTATNSILQTGVDFYVKDGQVSYDAWYEWLPDYAYNFAGFSISAGDNITVTITATSTTAGKAVVENISTGQTVSHSFSGQSAALEELNAEWIVEDFQSGGSEVPFADFGTVTFTGAKATTDSGTVGPSGATIFDIEQNDEVLTSVSVSSSEVVISYI